MRVYRSIIVKGCLSYKLLLLPCKAKQGLFVLASNRGSNHHSLFASSDCRHVLLVLVLFGDCAVLATSQPSYNSSKIEQRLRNIYTAQGVEIKSE